MTSPLNVLRGVSGNCGSCHLVTNWVTLGKLFHLSFILSSTMQLSPLTSLFPTRLVKIKRDYVHNDILRSLGAQCINDGH